MKGIYMKEVGRQAFRGVGWVGKAVLLCLGLLAVLTLVVVMSVLTVVMLTTTVLPATVMWQKRDLLRGGRDSGNTPQFSTRRKAVASQGR